MFNKCNNIHLRPQSFLLYFTTPHWVSNCKVLWTDLPFQHLYTGAVENNKILHFGLWHRGISKYDQCHQERDQFYNTVYLISDHQGQGQSGKYALEKCTTLRRNMTVQYLLLLTAILSGSINKRWWTSLSVWPTELRELATWTNASAG